MKISGAGEIGANRSHCPSCERFVGAVVECPFCSSDSARPLWVRITRLAAMAVSTGGVALLLISARHPDPEMVKISQISPSMNFANVRAEGSVVRASYVSRDAVPYLSFVIDDGSGRLRVSGSSDTAAELIESERIPQKGDRVSVCGSLQVTQGRMPRMYMKSITDCSAGAESGK